MATYRIADWEKNFENHRTRDLKRMEWVAIPNKMDGEGYTNLLNHRHGAAHFGVWIAMVQIASKREPRGTLPEVEVMSKMARMSVKVFSGAISRLLEIGWIIALPDVSVRDVLQQIELEGKSRAAAPESAGLPPDLRGIAAEKTLRTHARVSVPFPSILPEGSAEGRTAAPAPPVATVTKSRFDEWIERWPRNPSNERALHAFAFAWTADEDAAIFACRDRYLGSKDVAEGVCQNPDKFLNEQKQNNWGGRWPPARAAPLAMRPDRGFVANVERVMGERVARGEKPL